MATKKNYYTNPAFCQQSEFYNGQRPPQPLSPQGSIRQSPVGAQTPHRVLDNSVCDDGKKCTIDEEGVQEQEFYEEVVVDDQGFIKEKKFVIVAQNNEGKKYIQVPQSEDTRHGSRYALPPTEENRQGSRYGMLQQSDNCEPKLSENKSGKNQNHRYEYIPMQEHDSRYASKTTPKKQQIQEDAEALSQRVHRYAVIQTEEETELTTRNGRYALVPVEDLHTVVIPQNQPIPQKTVIVSQNKSRYEYIQDSPKQMVHQNPSRYEYIVSSPKSPVPGSRYEYIQQPQQRVGNPIATQKLHELLSTPKKISSTSRNCTTPKMLSPQSSGKIVPPPLSPIPKEFQIPGNSPPKARSHTPRAQQKLNYALGTRQLVQQDKRHTAIVAPMCSSPIHSVYSETTYSNKSESWMNLSIRKRSVRSTLAVAALMMLLCGTVTSGLCFYMISIMGRLYFLDFGIVAGFTCLILGLLGFRTSNVYWLPNRNYISGYLVLSVFSLLTCVGLLVLLVMQPRPGTPLADITSGAVCGISVFSLILAISGVVSSYCCKYPPPDNRVQHCAEGFTV